MTEKPYTKSLQDELDWKLLDQLYGVVSQISNFCFETKKFCLTTEFVVLAFMAKFTKDTLDHSIFIAGLVIPLCFWFLDAVAYFYQVKLRGTMEVIRHRLAREPGTTILVAGVIAPERATSPWMRRIFGAFLNHSMWLYAVLIVADLAVWYLYGAGVIK